MWKSLLLALALLPGLTAPAAAQGAGASPAATPPAGPSAEIAKHITDVASADASVQEAAAVALGKTGDRKILPLLEALREGSVYVRPLPGGKKETVIVGDKVTEGDKTLVPLFTRLRARAHRRARTASRCSRSSPRSRRSPTGRSLRLAIRPLIDAFSGQSELANPDPATRRAAATKMGNTGDAATRQVLEDALAKESDRWVRFALEEAIALIQLRTAVERRARDRGGDARRARQRERAGAPLPDRGRRRSAAPARGGGAGRRSSASSAGVSSPRASRSPSRASRCPRSCC